MCARMRFFFVLLNSRPNLYAAREAKTRVLVGISDTDPTGSGRNDEKPVLQISDDLLKMNEKKGDGHMWKGEKRWCSWYVMDGVTAPRPKAWDNLTCSSL